MQSQSQARDLVQLPDDGSSPNTTWSKSGPEPYYSNHDIAILHSIVAAAQDQLHDAPHPKPLPAAVLFKAYDDLLPTFGIDPDSDHHLSAFVFRIGGEQGNGTLSDKFQAILGRMGIVLEFDDNSVRTLPSLPISPAPSHSGRLDFSNGSRKHSPESIVFDVGVPSIPGTSAVIKDAPTTRHGKPNRRRYSKDDSPDIGTAQTASAASPVNPSQHRRRRDHRDAAEASVHVPTVLPAGPLPTTERGPRYADQLIAKDGEKRVSTAPRAALFSALDRWRSIATAKTPQRRRLDAHPSREHGVGSEASNRNGNAGPVAESTEAADRFQLASPILPAALVAGSEEAEMAQLRHQEAPHVSPDTISKRTTGAPQQVVGYVLHGQSTAGGLALTPVQYERLLRCAARAREIYLGSKVFNRWAERTTTRLGREAVARRHIIRFRCFRGWSQAPSSRLPAVDNLRAATAVQKLQRAVAYQGQQLSIAASAIAKGYLIKRAQRAVGRWTCQVVGHASRQRVARRIKLSAVGNWVSQAWESTACKQVAMTHTARCGRVNTFNRWRCQTEEDSRQFAAARQAGAACLLFVHLEEWLNQAEVKRRSQACRRNLLAEQASVAFNQWNSRARAQAFRWRCEYLSVVGAFDAWTERTRQNGQARSAAWHQHGLTSKAKLCRQVERVSRKHSDLEQLHARARLYIGAMHLLKILDRTVKQRKDRMKSLVRRYLMMRYTQVSSQRRKRNFYVALDRWKAATAEALDQVRVADDFKLASEALQRRMTFGGWGRHVLVEQELQAVAHGHYRRASVDKWGECYSRLEYRDAEAWGLWVSQQQRQCFKAWSIATLRRGGQVHTAIMAQHRHRRESRSRVLRQWKQSLSKSRGAKLEPDPGRPMRPGLPASYYSSGRSSIGRFSSQKEAEHPAGLMETPTRWTGLAEPMRSLLLSRPMAPVKETDNESTATSSAPGDGQAWERPRKAHKLDLSRTAALDHPTGAGAGTSGGMQAACFILEAWATQPQYQPQCGRRIRTRGPGWAAQQQTASKCAACVGCFR